MTTRKSSRKVATLELPSVLDVRAAMPLHGSLAGLRGRAVELDASQVQRLGGQCLQVLVAAAAAWRLDGV
ncbi:STAS domain-containing protein, partial [Aureimonas leprariae]